MKPRADAPHAPQATGLWRRPKAEPLWDYALGWPRDIRPRRAHQPTLQTTPANGAACSARTVVCERRHSFLSVATAVHLPSHELHEELHLQPARGLASRLATRLTDASGVRDNERPSPYALHSRHQLSVPHSSIHAHDPASEVNVDCLHTL
eukprot:CAMPEP_0119070156 /NCGR_PEP_ID=MMETSP1178-20130426/35557_1 /TAXON_ID=33656 /ORGANISM="unid sp, Strain CCMP2000" /LENGTH=150 /DNA_ID=CAMNT_0007051969 /DNA_START=294 /DNA_END=747 /DNA_ORIENTATION=-